MSGTDKPETFSPGINHREKAFQIGVLLDGRPGHEKQTLGVVAALGRKIPLKQWRISVPRPTPLARLVQLCRLFLPGGGLAHPQLGSADLLFGTGSTTHLSLLLYKKQYRIPIVTCMSPVALLRRRFDLCFIPEHDGIGPAGNILLTAGAPNSSSNQGQHDEQKGLILLGGIDPASHTWDNREIIRMVETIVSSGDSRSWVIASSPRTPDETLVETRHLADRYANAVFVDFRDTQPGWIEEHYALCSVAWVTADSISMMYEALAAGCRLGILPVPWRKKNSKFQNNEKIVLEKGLAISFDTWLTRQNDWSPAIYLNEAERCADAIVKLLIK
ncbi:MAG: ELM1/GtrOC1 family putative glycosyltransferase [Desulforhopalus sp.]|jgi:mitochondrial fission protein ELM1|nr:ELM1/GtrOC1 family putative glycosyltransferase [Desulforhopalus sp.]